MWQIMGAPSDIFRVSVSSALSTSSYGSAQDDNDAFGDLYVWGQIIWDSNVNSLSTRSDILLPKPLESNVVLDIHRVSCGVKHAALVTRQGELFTWGEDSGGCLGHGVGTHAVHPRLVESLLSCNIDIVACGEFHTCALSIAGELYSWGDGTHKAGLLGHGSHASQWIPRRVAGPLEGIHVAYVTCGTWHTALITSAGQLFTFGDGTFGVLGHGNRESVLYPREVETLMGLKTVSVACGVWHTAAVVEVIVTQSRTSSGKLFTWGDGDKYRLGHGDKEPRLKPTCVPSLIDYNFHKLACGDSLTIGLTTSGRIFTMGSTVYGQLGSSSSDGKLPCLVEDKLASECVKEVSCGSYHVAVLTTRNDVYTWGKGANGRLGHGDLEDRKTPTLVEALKDRPVRCITCGSNFTAAICHYKWVSGAEQSQCSTCRQAFGFTRKRHNCYNCGLVHCHSCSSSKALRAALSPNPGRPYRVCDSCYLKLNKVLDTSGSNERKNIVLRISNESKDKFDKPETKITKGTLPSNSDLIKNLDTKSAKQGRKSDPLKDMVFTGGYMYQASQAANHSRTVSPFSRKFSPPRSMTPIPTTSGLAFSKSDTDSLKKTNDLLILELQKLRVQVGTLTKRSELQEIEVEKSAKKAEEAMQFASEESAKSRVAKEVIKSLTAQLKDMAERLPHGIYEADTIRSRNEATNEQQMLLAMATYTALKNGTQGVNVNANINTEHNTKRETPTSASKMNQSPRFLPSDTNPIEAEWIEQYEPGVYITLTTLHDGTRELKRVRFSRRRFGEQEAEIWWTANREKVYKKYNIRGSDRITLS